MKSNNFSGNSSCAIGYVVCETSIPALPITASVWFGSIQVFVITTIVSALFGLLIVTDSQSRRVLLGFAPVYHHNVNFPETDTALLRADKLLATYTCYDWEYLKGGHPSGGNIRMRWHPVAGMVLAGTMREYSLQNGKLSLHYGAVRCYNLVGACRHSKFALPHKMAKFLF